MVSSTLAKKGLIALVWGLAGGPSQAQQAGSCTRSVTARSGDTCASLAESAGITVTQFLRSNPYVTSCSALVAGAAYCAEGTATGPPSAPATTSTAAAAPTRSSLPTSAASPSGPLRVSTDGSCGGSVTCAGSRFGPCCSLHGFCGSSSDYCGEGCQAGLGECSSPGGTTGGPPETITKPPDGVLTLTTTVTATIFVTSTVAETTGTTTSVVLVTSTTAATATVRATIIITSTLFQTSTVTSNVTQTQTARITATSTAVLTLSTTATSVAVSTSTSTAWRTSLTMVTRTVLQTSVVLETLTIVVTSTQVRQVTATTISTLTSTRVVTSTDYDECQPQQPTFPIGTTPTFIIGPPPTTTRPGGGGGGQITTITQLQPARPSPIIPGAPSNCKTYDKILSSDTCRQIATRNNITLREFYRLNPSVSSGSILGSLLCTPELLQLLLSGLCQIDCDDLWPGYYVCIGT